MAISLLVARLATGNVGRMHAKLHAWLGGQALSLKIHATPRLRLKLRLTPRVYPQQSNSL